MYVDCCKLVVQRGVGCFVSHRFLTMGLSVLSYQLLQELYCYASCSHEGSFHLQIRCSLSYEEKRPRPWASMVGILMTDFDLQLLFCTESHGTVMGASAIATTWDLTFS